MAWKVSADPVDFDEAVSWFRKRVSIPKAIFSALRAESRRKAFTIANVAKLDLVHQAWKALDSAIAKGTTLEDFKKEVGPALRAAWAGSVDDPAWRLETIFRTNVQHAYSAGRYRQATTPEVIEDRPVWMFDAILDGRETEFCKACDGTKRPADDPWWNDHYPPAHYNCRSSVITLTEEQAGKLSKAPTIAAQDGFGKAPTDTDAWTPDVSKYPEELQKLLEEKTREVA